MGIITILSGPEPPKPVHDANTTTQFVTALKVMIQQKMFPISAAAHVQA